MMDALRVLIIDDEAGMRSGASRVLRDYRVSVPDLQRDVSFDVSAFETGEAGLKHVEAHGADIILLDHKLPGMGGLDVLEKLQKYQSDLLVIMITAYASIDVAVAATKRGAYDFLAKPFTPEELRVAVRKAARQIILQREARRLAEEKRRLRFEFISVLAHELKSPLAAVEGYLNIVKGRLLGEELPPYDEHINRALVRLKGMSRLIFDLLDLTRIESGQKKRTFETVDLVEVARQSMETQELEAEPRGITLNLQAEDELKMYADPGEVEIVLNNLISNAVKYNKDGGRVDVDLKREQPDGPVVIKVTDTGIGMTEEQAGKLFADFVRIKSAKTRNIMGSGLGLSTVRKLARLYGGDASVKSRPDEGSTFTVVLHDAEDADATSHATPLVNTAAPAEGSD